MPTSPGSCARSPRSTSRCSSASLDKPLIVGAAAVIGLVVAFTAYARIGQTFMPVMNEGTPVITIRKHPTISVNMAAETDMRIQRAIMERVPEVKGMMARAGADELGIDPVGLNDTDNFLTLAPQSEWRGKDMDWLMGEIRAVLDSMPGISYAFSQPIDMRVQEMIIGARGDVVVKIFGDDIDELNRLTREVAATLRKIRGARDVFGLQNDGMRYLTARVDRLAAGRFGLNAGEIQDALRVWVDGQPVGIVLEGPIRTPLVIRGSEISRRSSVDFARLPMVSSEGKVVELSQLADVRVENGPIQIIREEGRRFATVLANVTGRDLVGFVDDAKKAVAKNVKTPPGYRYQWGGQFENQQRASARLAIVVPIALALIFLLLYLTFNSVLQATLVFCNVPFAAIGGILGLWLSGEFMSVPSSVGFIALDRHRRAQRRRAHLLHQQACGRRHAQHARSGAGRRASAHAARHAHRHHRGLRLDPVPVRAWARRRDPAPARHRRHRRVDLGHGADLDPAADSLRSHRQSRLGHSSEVPRASDAATRANACARGRSRMRMGAVYTAFFLFAFALLFETGVFAQEQGEPAEMQIKASVKAAPKKARVTSPKKARARPPTQRSGGVLAKHLEMAVLVDAQSRSLEAQFRAISARYATANSITPGSPYFAGYQRNAAAGNLRNYNETEIEAGMPLWLPGQRDAFAGTVTTGLFEVEERLALRRLEVAGVLRDAWWNAQRAAREVSVARNRVATARDIGADMTRRVELGDAAQTDALLAKNETLAAETELAQSEGAVKVARITYAALTGGAPPDGALESVRPPIDIEDHPALRTPLAALARARAQVELVDATPIDSPDIGIFGSAGT